MARERLDSIDLFPGPLFMNYELSYHEYFFTKHMHTGTWGRENIHLVDDLAQDYKGRSGVDPNDLDFFHDYTQDRFLKEDRLDIDRNITTALSSMVSRIRY